MARAPAISHEGLQSVEELAVLRAIVAREDALDRLLDLCCAFEGDASVELLEQMLVVRERSIEIVERIAGWRRRMVQQQPFRWRDVNYLLKMTSDLDFVSKSQLATAALDGTRMLKRNPFLTIGGLDHSMRALWKRELPQPDDLPVLLDAASFGPDTTLDFPTRLRLAEWCLVCEENRFGRFPSMLAVTDHRLKALVQREAEFASKARFGATRAHGND